jgi:hypothetical protein
MAKQCPECGGDTVIDRDENELLCVSDKDCLWWKDLDTGNEWGETQ